MHPKLMRVSASANTRIQGYYSVLCKFVSRCKMENVKVRIQPSFAHGSCCFVMGPRAVARPGADQDIRVHGGSFECPDGMKIDHSNCFDFLIETTKVMVIGKEIRPR